MENFIRENNERIEITEAKESDFINFRELLFESWLATYVNENVGVTTEDIVDFFKDRFSDEKKEAFSLALKDSNRKTLIAKIKGVMVGIASMTKESNMLSLLYIKPNMQGKGVGTRLWESLEASFDTKRPIILDVVTYNDRAIKFYEKLGFKNNNKKSNNAFVMNISGSVIENLEMEKLSNT